MSTLLSADLKWDKSSTRRYAPPGGQSSISLGDYVTPTPTKQPRAANGSAGSHGMASPSGKASPTGRGSPLASPKHGVAASPGVAAALAAMGVHVGVAVCEASGLKAATVAALQKMGAKATVYEVADPMQLPFAAKCLVANAQVSVVVAMGFLVQDSHWCSKEVAGALVKTLLELSLAMQVPIINGLVFSRGSAGDLNALSCKLATSAMDMAAMSEGGKESYTVSRVAVPASPFGKVARSLNASRKNSVFRAPQDVPGDLSSLMLGLRTSLVAHGVKGIFQLARRFRISDDDKSGDISFHEFQVCMRDAHMGWTEDELKNVFEHFDHDGSGRISYDEFLCAVRGPVSARRAQLILQAFEIMDKDKSGTINSQDLKGTYDVSKHPDVATQRCTPEDAMEEFLSTFEGEVKDGKVTPQEWCRYYGMVSAGIDEDDYFELMMRNAWHLPGGEGALANTSIRRVLATRADGTQTVEEVKDAAGIEQSDTRAMLASLRAQGLNVAAVELFGSLDTTEAPATKARAMDISEAQSSVDAASAYSRPVRQGPGGNSSLVLG